MAHIPERDVERLKANISLVTLLEQQGFTLKKHGKDYATCCPFHDDKTPSLVITPDKNLYHCFGCGAAGSVIDWMMNLEKVSFRKAVELLQAQASSFATSGIVASSQTHAPATPKAKNALLDDETQALLSKVVDHYHDRLSQSEAVQTYLSKRGLNDTALIQTFRLGFCDRKLGQILAARNSGQGKAERAMLSDVGVLLGSGIERFAGSLVVPVIQDGQVLEIYGRKVGDRLKKGTPLHVYLPGKHRGIWNLAGIQGQAEIIVCESLIDAMTLWVHGFKNVTTSYGVHGFTDDLHQYLQNTRDTVETVLIAYDRDEAGNNAAEALRARLAADKITALRLAVPPSCDVNEWALREQEGFADAFNDCLLNAKATMSSFSDANRVMEQTGTIPEKTGVLELVRHGLDLQVDLGLRHYRVRGLEKNKHREQLKINLMTRHGDNFFIDTVDLYHAKQRQSFIQHAAVECGLEENTLKADLGKLLLTLEHEQEAYLFENAEEKAVELTEMDKESALDYLRDPSLLSRLVRDMNACGLVGEDTNAVVGYLAGVSRLLEKPLAVMIQSTSAAGKSTLMDAVLNMMPKEERVQYSAMTGQSLYYLGETDLKHKILAIAEEEGASNASYALKLLQSEGEITIASTGKDETTGDLTTKEYTVEGPVMLFLTTTAIDIDEELLNRCLVLTVNESQEQTEAIHAQQRFNDTIDGLLAKENKNRLLALHHNAQRLLKPLHVVNPFAEQLTFLSHQTRTRRDHQKYLTLIKSIALLHQYQRQIKTVQQGEIAIEYIEVTEQDIVYANTLAHEVLGRTLDELPPQTRKLLRLINDYVKQQSDHENCASKDVRFSRRDIREFTGWGNTQLKVHCQRLEEMEYLVVRGGGRGQLIEYRLLHDGDKGLNDVGLTHLDVKKSGQKIEKSGGSRPQVGPKSGGSRGPQNGVQPRCDKTLELFESEFGQKRIILSDKNEHHVHPSV